GINKLRAVIDRTYKKESSSARRETDRPQQVESKCRISLRSHIAERQACDVVGLGKAGGEDAHFVNDVIDDLIDGLPDAALDHAFQARLGKLDLVDVDSFDDTVGIQDDAVTRAETDPAGLESRVLQGADNHACRLSDIVQFTGLRQKIGRIVTSDAELDFS